MTGRGGRGVASETLSWARRVCGGFETLTGRCGCDAVDVVLSLQHCMRVE